MTPVSKRPIRVSLCLGRFPRTALAAVALSALIALTAVWAAFAA